MAKRARATADADPPETPVESAGLAPRMSVQLNTDGTRVAWDRIRNNTRDQLRLVMSDPDLSQQLGVPAPNVGGQVSAFDPALVPIIYDTLSTLLIALARRSGYDESAAAVMRFSPMEKQALTDPTAKVMAKYSHHMGKYQDEILLGVLVTTIISGKLTLLRKSATVIPFPSADGNDPENPPTSQ